jgi:hypothetical protein
MGCKRTGNVRAEAVQTGRNGGEEGSDALLSASASLEAEYSEIKDGLSV